MSELIRFEFEFEQYYQMIHNFTFGPSIDYSSTGKTNGMKTFQLNLAIIERVIELKSIFRKFRKNYYHSWNLILNLIHSIKYSCDTFELNLVF